VGQRPTPFTAAIKFFLYTLAGSVVMLLAILALYFYAPVAADGTRTFDVPTLLAARRHFSDPLKVWLFWDSFLPSPLSSDVPVPHVAPGRAHGSAHGGLRSFWPVSS